MNRDINPHVPICPLCSAEVIPLHEYGKEGPQRLVCCRLVPMCGAQWDLDGHFIDPAGPYTEQETTR